MRWPWPEQLGGCSLGRSGLLRGGGRALLDVGSSSSHASGSFLGSLVSLVTEVEDLQCSLVACVGDLLTGVRDLLADLFCGVGDASGSAAGQLGSLLAYGARLTSNGSECVFGQLDGVAECRLCSSDAFFDCGLLADALDCVFATFCEGVVQISGNLEVCLGDLAEFLG